MPRLKKICPPVESLTVRFPQGMLDALRIQAKQNDRSLNAEIIHDLRHWVTITPSGDVHEPHRSCMS